MKKIDFYTQARSESPVVAIIVSLVIWFGSLIIFGFIALAISIFHN